MGAEQHEGETAQRGQPTPERGRRQHGRKCPDRGNAGGPHQPERERGGFISVATEAMNATLSSKKPITSGQT